MVGSALKSLGLETVRFFRRILKRAERFPGAGALFMVPPLGQLMALRDAFVIAFFGSIGLWLPAWVAALEKIHHLSLAGIWGNLHGPALRGDALILVPSLIAPLYLLIGALSDNRLHKRHQISIFVVAVLGALGAVVIYVTKIANTVADVNFLIRASEYGFLFSFVVLYLYFLLAYLPKGLLPAIQESPSSLADRVLELRNEGDE